MPAASLSSLRDAARAAAENAHAPFSGERAAAALLLSDGTWVPGVRVESASFSLTMPAVLNAFTTAVAAGQGTEVIAAAFSRPLRRAEQVFLEDVSGRPPEPAGADACLLTDEALPTIGERLDPFLPGDPPDAPDEGVARARTLAERTLVPASHFPVCGVLAIGGRLVPGVNVEPVPADAPEAWTHVLCAERNALGTACTYGLLGEGAAGNDEDSSEGAVGMLYLSCPEDAACSPCGACRQLLVELLPRGVLWMDRAPDDPERIPLSDLLPGSFRGAALSRRTPHA